MSLTFAYILAFHPHSWSICINYYGYRPNALEIGMYWLNWITNVWVSVTLTHTLPHWLTYSHTLISFRLLLVLSQLCSFFWPIMLFFYAAFITNYAPKMYQLCSHGLLTYALSSNNSPKQSILAKGTPAFLNYTFFHWQRLSISWTEQLTVRNY